MRLLNLCAFVVLSLSLPGCSGCTSSTPTSAAGIKQTHADISPGSDGLTVEQRNVKMRIEQDNKPGAIKHLYVLSAYSGQCILYSTVKGKVTSSGKRLTPYTVKGRDSAINENLRGGQVINIGGTNYCTEEVLQDDGTYGSSVEYVYWWDQRGVYHQHYVSGGQILHVASEPIPMKSVIINVEQVAK